MSRDYERSGALEKNYAQEIDAILSRPLMPEIIDTYAEQALTDLVEVVESVAISYTWQPTISHQSAKATEEAAFRYHGLSDIETTLDHVADLAGDIQRLDSVVARATIRDDVVLPSNESGQVVIGKGESDWQEKELIPRLKTILLVLEKDFEIDVHNPDEVAIEKGIVNDNMVRDHSYYALTIPRLNRLVFVNDEEDNATYIFDTELIKECGFEHEELMKSTKQELLDLIEMQPDAGRRLRYTANFIHHMRSYLARFDDGSEHENKSHSVPLDYYLIPNAPEGYISLSSFATKKCRMNKITIEKVLARIAPETLDVLGVFKFKGKPAKGMSPQQQEIFMRLLIEHEIVVLQAPEGYRSTHGIANALEVSDRLIANIIEKLESEGQIEGTIMRFSKRKAVGYSPEDQSKINNDLVDRFMNALVAPNDYLPVKGISAKYAISKNTLVRILENISGEIGEVDFYRFGSNVVKGYSPAQQVVIEQAIREAGYFSEKASSGVLSVAKIREDFGVDHRTVSRGIIATKSQLGEVKKYRFGTQISPGFDPGQVEIIKNWIGENVKGSKLAKAALKSVEVTPDE